MCKHGETTAPGCRRFRSLIGVVAGTLLVLPASIAFGQAAVGAKEAPATKHLPGSIRLLLPPRIYAVPGIEMNVYFDNVCLALNWTNYVFDVTCVKGVQQAERWTVVPTEQDRGEYPFILEVRNEANQLIAHAETVLQVAPKNAGAETPVTFLTIGASETHAAVYPAHLLELCKTPGNPRLTLVGHTPDPSVAEVRIEGYGGWTARRFMTHFTTEKRAEGKVHWKVWNASSSPFLYSDGAGGFKADFALYCRDFNQGKAPDFITITLGGNDTFSCTEETIEKALDIMVKHYDGLIDAIRQVGKDTTIGVVLMYPPAASQDAFGANYGCGQTLWQCKRNFHRLAERVIQHYGHRENERVYLVPVKSNLDCVHNFPAVKTPWNSQTKTEGVRLNNALHPTAEGYRQVGDTIYCWMKARCDAAADAKK